MKIVRASSQGVKQVQYQGLPFLGGEEPDLIVTSLEAVGLGTDELFDSTTEFLSQSLG
jgi:hypothetical protein